MAIVELPSYLMQSGHFRTRDWPACSRRAALIVSVIGATLLSSCSQPQELQPTSAGEQQALEERERKDGEEKAWTDASSAGTAPAITAYLKDYGSGAHAAEARQRLSALEEQARKQDETLRRAKALALGMPTIDIQKTCRISANVSGAASSQANDDGCINSEQGARDNIVRQWTEFSTVERTLCINRKAYLPSYVEWLTCLEMQRDVRKLKQRAIPPKGKQ
jgi:hypothetical protein